MKAEKRFRELKIERKAIDENSTGFYVTAPTTHSACLVRSVFVLSRAEFGVQFADFFVLGGNFFHESLL